jgi:hypothetical protein
MALSACPKCEHLLFEIVTVEPSGSNYKMNLVQCSACGTPIGVTEFYDAGELLTEQAEKLEEMDKRLIRIERAVRALAEK